MDASTSDPLEKDVGQTGDVPSSSHGQEQPTVQASDEKASSSPVELNSGMERIEEAESGSVTAAEQSGDEQAKKEGGTAQDEINYEALYLHGSESVLED